MTSDKQIGRRVHKDKAIEAIASRANGWIYVVSLLWSHYCSMVRGNTASEAEACYEMLRNPCTWDDNDIAVYDRYVASNRSFAKSERRVAMSIVITYT